MAEPFDVTNCDTEPIHIPGSIQPHGILIALGPAPDLRIEQISANAADLFAATIDDLLGQDFDSLLAADPQIIASLRDGQTVQNLPVALGTTTQIASYGPSPVSAHRRADGSGGFLVEIERPLAEEPRDDADSFFRFVNQTFLQLRAAPTRQALYDRTVAEVRRLTGFDRVMLYRFHADEHGEVVAEALREDMEPFFGLHYPASDIPRQARALYVRSHIRLIADVGYSPVPLLARDAQEPLDLTHASLRSVSLVHLQYLKNMGVASSMSISIVHEDRLWGLIACHHETPHYLAYQTRNICELIGQTVAAQIVAYDAREEIAARDSARVASDAVAERTEKAVDPAIVLVSDEGSASLRAILHAGGVAVLLANGDDAKASSIAMSGATPDEPSIRALLDFLADSVPDDIFQTDCLAAVYPPADAFTSVGSGLTAIAISRAQPTRSYLLVFRPEVISTVDWAGDPTTKVVVDTAAGPSLSPRASFASWKQTVRGHSAPWSAADRTAADLLRRAIVGATLTHAQASLTARNAELRQSNDELDAFAFVASHDLREPLRGIRNYARFLHEDYRQALDAEGGGMLDTIGRLTTRMEQFLDSLLDYSRVGKTELLLRPVDMNVIVAEALEVLSFRLEEQHIEVRLPRRLPPVMADAVRTGEVWANLITNAAKYNKSEQKWIEIGFLDRSPAEANLPVVYYVRDNGIGIEERNYNAVFYLFRRLHERDQFGGGTGSGLTIARRIAERHGGRLWVDSQPGQGSTFYFTLAPTAIPAAAQNDNGSDKT